MENWILSIPSDMLIIMAGVGLFFIIIGFKIEYSIIKNDHDPKKLLKKILKDKRNFIFHVEIVDNGHRLVEKFEIDNKEFYPNECNSRYIEVINSIMDYQEYFVVKFESSIIGSYHYRLAYLEKTKDGFNIIYPPGGSMEVDKEEFNVFSSY